MTQLLSDDRSDSVGHEEWRCSGTFVSCKNIDESHTGSHDASECDTRQEPAETDYVIPNSNIVGSPAMQQSAVNVAHQPDIRPENVNLVILSSTAKLVVDSGCFDHCCPLGFATHFELKEGRFLNASAANTTKLKHYGTTVVEGWTRDVNGTQIPFKIRFNVFDVTGLLLSKLRQHGYSVALDQQKTIQKGGTTIVLTDQNGLSTLELRVASRPEEVDEQMCAPVEGIGEEARTATPMYVRIVGCRATSSRKPPYAVQILVRILRQRTRKGESSPQSRREVTFLTMVDSSSGSMVATAVQKEGHDKFVERFLLNSLESFGRTGEMVLQTDKEAGPIDMAKHSAAERKATTIIRQTPKKSSQSNAYVERAHQSVEAMVRTMKDVIEDDTT